MARSRTLLCSALLLVIVGSACAVAETVAPTVTLTLAPMITPHRPTSTASLTATVTLTPSHTATATPVPVTPSATYTPSVTFTPTSSNAVAIPARELPVRSGPGLTYPVVDNVEADVAIPIYAMSDDGAWVLISALGQDGRWLGLSPFVQLGGDWENISVWSATPTSTATASPSPTATVTLTPIPTVDVDAIVETVVAQVVATLSVNLPAEQNGLQPASYVDVSADDDPVLGSDNAPITIIEFGDYADPYGKRFADEVLPRILDEYGDQVRLVFRDYPILGQGSVLAALAANCANDQRVFWKYHDRLLRDQENLSQEQLLVIAAELKLDMETFTSCLDGQIHMNEITTDYDTAAALGLTGVPTFFINGFVVSGAQLYEVFEDAIDRALAEATAEPE